MKPTVNKYAMFLIPHSYGCMNGQGSPTVWENLIKDTHNMIKERKEEKVTRNKVDMERKQREMVINISQRSEETLHL